jgi:DNA-directed RNA polymerase specialized sigma24 family protein
LRTKKPGPEVTVESFSSFLAWLSPDGDRAGEEYELLRYKLCTYFGSRRCSVPDELADETINRVILKSGDEVIENKLAYFYGVARNVYREFLRKQPAHLDIDKVVLPSTPPDEPGFSRECLDKCLDELPPQKKELVLQYFTGAKTAKINLRRQISETMEKSKTAVRMEVMRIKSRLKRCVQDCMSGEGVT